jgi:hypothetical protein
MDGRFALHLDELNGAYSLALPRMRTPQGLEEAWGQLSWKDEVQEKTQWGVGGERSSSCRFG